MRIPSKTERVEIKDIVQRVKKGASYVNTCMEKAGFHGWAYPFITPEVNRLDILDERNGIVGFVGPTLPFFNSLLLAFRDEKHLRELGIWVKGTYSFGVVEEARLLRAIWIHEAQKYLPLEVIRAERGSLEAPT